MLLPTLGLGLSDTGKSTLGRLLADTIGCPLWDTDSAFLLLAHAEIAESPTPTSAEIKNAVGDSELRSALEAAEVCQRASQLMEDPSSRNRCENALTEFLAETDSCIIIGQGSWRFLTDDDSRILLRSSAETRARRRILSTSHCHLQVLSMTEAESIIRSRDRFDSQWLPAADLPGLHSLLNDGRDLQESLVHLVSAAVRVS